MKRNTRVIQIRGIRGLLITMFIVCCLIAGFVAFPAFMTMHAWNYLAAKTGSFPTINFYAGVLLWAIITLSVYLFNKHKFIISFNAQHELTEDELKEVVSKIKSQVMDNPVIFQNELPPDLLTDVPKEFKTTKNKTEETEEITTEKK